MTFIFISTFHTHTKIKRRSSEASNCKICTSPNNGKVNTCTVKCHQVKSLILFPRSFTGKLRDFVTHSIAAVPLRHFTIIALFRNFCNFCNFCNFVSPLACRRPVPPRPIRGAYLENSCNFPIRFEAYYNVPLLSDVHLRTVTNCYVL